MIGKKIIFATTIHYFLGIRGFFLSFCLIGWVFHPIACLVVTVCIIGFMYLSDHSFTDISKSDKRKKKSKKKMKDKIDKNDEKTRQNNNDCVIDFNEAKINPNV